MKPPWPSTALPSSSKKNPRRLFLDDDPERASTFLKAYPDAVWVQTAADCVSRLSEPWDEVHLDHDLGGEHFVDVDRDDCGMEVVRWLAREPRRHLRRARFTVHSHNLAAAFEMTMRLRELGFQVEARPFGVEPPAVARGPEAPSTRLRERAIRLLRRLRELGPIPPREPVDADRVDDDE